LGRLGQAGIKKSLKAYSSNSICSYIANIASCPTSLGGRGNQEGEAETLVRLDSEAQE